MTADELRGKYNITEYRSARRKSIELRAKGVSGFEVRVPLYMPRRDIDSFIVSHADWLDRTAKKLAQNAAADLPKLTCDELNALADEALADILERVSYYAPIVGVTCGKITIRCQHTRWGSCTAKGNLNFNCLLMLMPPEIRNYIVVHELCHRIELNHSYRFWNEVERVMPDYKKRRNWLKENGSALISRLP